MPAKEEEKTNAFISCLNKIERRSLVVDNVPIIKEIVEGDAAINEETYSIGTNINFVNYSIFKISKEGEFLGIIEEVDSNYLSRKAFFEIEKKRFYVNDIIDNYEVPSYNYLIDSLVECLGEHDRKYIINLVHDCEACYQRIIYKILIDCASRKENIYFCGESPSPNE